MRHLDSGPSGPVVRGGASSISRFRRPCIATPVGVAGAPRVRTFFISGRSVLTDTENEMPGARGKRSRPAVADPVADRVWVEELAMLLERQGGGGFPRTAGRVLALLLVAHDATVTQADLAERLSVSQAAV